MLKYSYAVNAYGEIRGGLASGDPQLIGRIDAPWLTTESPWYSRLDISSRDLLRVATAVLAADRLSLRRAAKAKALHRELPWQRDINLRIAVERPQIWHAAADALRRLLLFLSDDRWTIQFESCASLEIQLLLFHSTPHDCEVALFSGGLDSAAGMLARHQECPSRQFIAASWSGNNVRVRTQQNVIECLQQLQVPVQLVSFHHHLERLDSKPHYQEVPQRTRGFAFLAMGAVVASIYGADRVSIYETGVGALNISMGSCHVGSKTTRAVHPYALLLTEKLVHSVLSQCISFDLPFFFETKGQMCAVAGSGLFELGKVAISCDEGDHSKKVPYIHCGICTSCLFRRSAIFIALRGRDPSHYRDESTTKHEVYDLEMFESHILRLAQCSCFEDLVQIDSAVSKAVHYLVDRGWTQDKAKSKIFDIFSTYQAQTMTFLRDAKPAVARAKKQRKELVRDLFAAAG